MLVMISSDFKQSLAISRLCDDILESNERIFFVSSINYNGRVFESRSRNDSVLTKLSKSETEMFFMQRTLQTSLSKEFDDIVGPLNFITVQRETFLELIFPYTEGLILVVCDLDVVPNYLAKRILFVLRDFDWASKNSQIYNA
ncbi:hypothetical protein NZNM25_04090 [Nitrosopumilus zosterae]|uniref:Uncharacterized protein n=2 Tax=Nitrosopumilaceae TaxID=338190 RepID=A0A2S2KQ86_9ARCH|nr:hypothetical protein NZNM25_04090 [Nitrosopumilus zosterae]